MCANLVHFSDRPVAQNTHMFAQLLNTDCVININVHVVRGSLFSKPCRARIVLLGRDKYSLQAVKLNKTFVYA